VQRDADGRGHEVAAKQSDHAKCQQRFKSPKRYEPKEYPDCRAYRDRVRLVLEVQELCAFRAKPINRVHGF
jgi:hypothetical protein